MVDNVYVTGGEPLRVRLVSAGVDLLEEEGVGGLTLRAVTRRTGVSHGAPRRYFATHNSLLAAIAASGLSDLAAGIGPVLGAVDVQAEERLIRLGLEYVQFAERRPAMFELIFRHDLLEGAGANLREKTLPLFDSLVRLVAEACPECEDSRERAIGVWTNLHGIAVLTANRSLGLVGASHDLPKVVAQVVRRHLS